METLAGSETLANMKLYFSDYFGERFALKSEKDLGGTLDKPLNDYITTTDKYVQFGKKKVKIDDLSTTPVCVRDRNLIKKLEGKKFHLVDCHSPHEIINYRPNSVECILDKKFYVLPNGQKHYKGKKLENWTKKWGTKSKVEFNHKAFLEAELAVNKNELEVAKPKGKSKNPFFDPKVVGGQRDDTQVAVGMIALDRKQEVASSTLACDNCVYKNKCPKFMAGSVCGYSDSFKYLSGKIKSRDIDLITESIQDIIADEAERYEMSKHFERVSGEIDGRTTQIGDLLFKKLTEFVKLVKPELNQGVTYNILNQQVNIGSAVEKLEDAGLSDKQRAGLAETVDQILKKEKQK